MQKICVLYFQIFAIFLTDIRCEADADPDPDADAALDLEVAGSHPRGLRHAGQSRQGRKKPVRTLLEATIQQWSNIKYRKKKPNPGSSSNQRPPRKRHIPRPRRRRPKVNEYLHVDVLVLVLTTIIVLCRFQKVLPPDLGNIRDPVEDAQGLPHRIDPGLIVSHHHPLHLQPLKQPNPLPSQRKTVSPWNSTLTAKSLRIRNTTTLQGLRVT